jgi:hypothetical protein
MGIETTGRDPGSHRFTTGLEGVSEIRTPLPTIDLRPGGLLRQNSPLGSRIDELYAAGKLDELLYDSVKPATQLTTRTGTIGFSESLAAILGILPDLCRECSISPEETSAIESTIRDDINNQELLAACRRALLGG